MMRRHSAAIVCGGCVNSVSLQRSKTTLELRELFLKRREEAKRREIAVAQADAEQKLNEQQQQQQQSSSVAVSTAGSSLDLTRLDPNTQVARLDSRPGQQKRPAPIGEWEERMRRHYTPQPPSMADLMVGGGSLPIVQPANPRALHLAIMGPPNSGKSSLINGLVRRKVSAVSRKAQTTGTVIRAALTSGATQLIFEDTPSIVRTDGRFEQIKHRGKWGTQLTRTALAAAAQCDYVALVIDAVKRVDDDLKLAVKLVEQLTFEHGIPSILVVNKTDLLTKKHRLQTKIQEIDSLGNKCFSEHYEVSALQERGLDDLVEYLQEKAVPRDWTVPGHLVSLMSDVRTAYEVIREKLFLCLNEELPHLITQETVGWTKSLSGTLIIDQNIYVKRTSQKIIVVGTKGRVIDQISDKASRDLTMLLNRPVRVNISVKIRPNLTSDVNADGYR